MKQQFYRILCIVHMFNVHPQSKISIGPFPSEPPSSAFISFYSSEKVGLVDMSITIIMLSHASYYARYAWYCCVPQWHRFLRTWKRQIYLLVWNLLTEYILSKCYCGCECFMRMCPMCACVSGAVSITLFVLSLSAWYSNVLRVKVCNLHHKAPCRLYTFTHIWVSSA